MNWPLANQRLRKMKAVRRWDGATRVGVAGERKYSVNQVLTFCVIGKIEGGVKIVDPAGGTDISPALRVVLAGRGSKDEHDVIIPHGRDPFRAGRSLVPEGDLGGPWNVRSSACGEWTRPSRQGKG